MTLTAAFIISKARWDYSYNSICAYALGKLQANGRQVNNAKISQNLANCDNRFDNILKDSSL